MATIPPIKYPLDLTGRSPDNLIVGEPHTIGATGNRAIVPLNGPFFTRGLVVRKASDGTPLTPRVHYKAAQLFPEATYRTGQEICSTLVIDDLSVGTEFLLDYQTIGGEYTVSVDAIQRLIDTLSLDERPVRWGAILGKPEYFPPVPHLHDLGDLYGFEYIVAAIEGVRQAILLGDVFRDQEIYDYIDLQDTLLRTQIINVESDINAHLADLNNPHQTTKAQVGLGNVENLPLASDAQAKAGVSHVTYMTPLRTKAAVDVHALRVDNPHNVTKAQVGLGAVDNFATATTAQALQGTANNLFLTPLGAQAMINKAFAEWTPETVYLAPDVKFVSSGATTVEYNQNFTISFTNQTVAGSEAITSWLWDFGNGQTSTLQNPPAQTYTTTGSKTVTLTVQDASANPARVYSITLNLVRNAAPAVPPTVDFTYTGPTTTMDPNNPILDFAPSVTAGSAAIASYYWEFDVGQGAGATSTQADPGPYTYTIPIGSVTKTVRLTVTDVNGLSGSRTKNIVLNKSASNVPPTANITYTGATTVQDPAVHSIDFNSTSTQGTAAITSYAWDFGDGTTSNVANPAPKNYTVPVGSRSFTVTLTVTDANGLTNTKTITLNLTKTAAPLVPPTANFTRGGNLTVLEGSNHSISVTDTSTPGSGTITSWLWDWGDGTANSSGKTPPAHTYVVPVGSTNRTITLTTTDSNGLTDTHQVSFTLVKTAITPPTAAFNRGGALTVTEPSNHVITFTDASVQGTGAISSWSWDFGDGTSYSGQTPPAHTYNVPLGTTNVTVKLTVTDQYGRSNTAQQTLTLVKNAFTLAAPTNLNFEAGDTGWTKTSASITSAGAAAVSGTWRGRVTNTAAAGAYADMSGVLLAQGGVAVTPGSWYEATGYVRPSSGSSGKGDNVVGATRLIWLDYWGNVIGSVQGNEVQMAFSNNQWVLSSAKGLAPDGARYMTAQGDCFIRWGGASVEFDSFGLGPTTPPSGGGGGGGGGDPGCVATTMYLEPNLLAGDVEVDAMIDVAVYGDAPSMVKSAVRSNRITQQPTYLMTTISGIQLIASDSTPMTLQDGTSKKFGPEMEGELVLVDDRGELRWEPVVSMRYAGMRDVIMLSVDDQCYFAGIDPLRRIASHNVLDSKQLQ